MRYGGSLDAWVSFNHPLGTRTRSTGSVTLIMGIPENFVGDISNHLRAFTNFQ
jgi:hypothetical protein